MRSVIVHEMWHHWQHAKGYSSSHLTGPTGACTTPGAACDWFYPHGVHDFDFNQLNNYRLAVAEASSSHSPYQIQVEFDCDLAQMSFDSVPLSVTQAAKSSANARLATQFKNAAGYRCGNPRPF